MQTEVGSPIPRLIHQTWKTRDVPPELQGFQRSWTGRNPGFAYRFWTDDDIEHFVAEEHPVLLPVFRGYADPIARIDLARYLILRRFGGVYVDLDFECLRPIDGLLEGRSFVVGLEPEEHGRLAKAAERGLARILCPSFLASVPGHPFWDHLLSRLIEARSSADVLDATGPFLLTRAHASYEGARYEDDPAAATVLPPQLLYPVTKDDCWSGRLFDPVFWERATRDAYAVHHWEGTWFRGAAERGAGPGAGLPRQIAAVVTDGRPEGEHPAVAKAEGHPLISCLMVTRGRSGLLRLAIEGFARQTYPNRELVIVCDSPALPQDDPLERAIRDAACPNIRLIRVRIASQSGTQPAGLTLGELRNIAVDQAAGRYVCQWDDDDLYDPCRLEMQQRVLAATGAQACLLGRWMIWWPAEDRLAVSCERDWEGSLLCETAVMPRYPALRRGEDTPVVAQLRRSARVVRMDLPRLYTYVVHGGNTFTAPHFEAHWQAAAVRFEDGRCRAVLEEMGKRLPVEAYRRTASNPATDACSASPPVGRNIDVEVAGHLTAAIGLGSAVRGTVTALRASGLPVTVIDLPLDETHPVPLPAFPLGTPLAGPALAAAPGAFAVTLVHTNPDALRQALNAPGRDPRLDPRRLLDRLTIGYWAWEASSGIPEPWRDCLPVVDEIWVPSTFTAAAVAPHVAVPVIAMPHAVTAPSDLPAFDRQAFGIPDGTVCFLFLFNGTSNVTRKNPAGLIRAYCAAFPNAASDTLLIIKAKKLADGARRALEALADGRPDIRIVNEPWTAERTAALMAACDAYVSLHRAEGFGLTVAEAMAGGKPVIATAYSGTMDITTPDTAYLVPCRTTMLEADDGYYRRGTVWADPDLEAAARLMRRVASHPDEARAVGARAAARMRTHFSPEAVGARMRDRLSVLMASRVSPLVRQAARLEETGRAERGAERVLVLTPVKDAVAHLPRYLDLLGRLDHDPSRLSLGFLEGDSRDGTHDWLAARLPELQRRYRRVTLLRHDHGFRPDGPRWAPAIQRRRREVLARARNRLLSGALGDEDWVLWLDADLVDYPPDLLARLLTAGRDIVVPHCVLPDGRTFDLNSFRLDGTEVGEEDPCHLVDGILQPPRGVGRRYLDAFAGEEIVPLDGVGGTALLIRADLHREGLCFPPYSHRGYIETEGLAMMARDMGVTAWGLPDLRIVHGV
ncbi:MAG TPA: glycosyltransferase [Azospirillum sp.]|nr:glycosyltransferase [Azospirillum sp.]